MQAGTVDLVVRRGRVEREGENRENKDVKRVWLQLVTLSSDLRMLQGVGFLLVSSPRS